MEPNHVDHLWTFFWMSWSHKKLVGWLKMDGSMMDIRNYGCKPNKLLGSDLGLDGSMDNLVTQSK